MLPLWAQGIVVAMVVAMVAWASVGFAGSLKVLRSARTPGEKTGARLHVGILGVRLGLVVVLVGMLVWAALKG